MVSVGFSIAANAGLGAILGPVGVVAGGLLTAYIDNTWVLPAMFGKKSPKPDALEGFQVSTTDPGAPRWEVYGSRAWVPCHYLWSLNIRDEVNGNGQVGKGGRPFVQTVRADVGLAACDGPVIEIDTLYSGERVFWSRQFDRVVVEDHRWSITAGSGPTAGLLIIAATDADVTDFAGVFDGGDLGDDHDGDFTLLEGVSPASLNGYWRVVRVDPHGGGGLAAASGLSTIALKPLRGQTPATGVAGNLFQPAALRRIDHGAASAAWTVVPTGNGIRIIRPLNEGSIPGAPDEGEAELQKVWFVGARYRLDGASPSTINGLWRLTARTGFPSPGAGSPINDYMLTFVPLENQLAGGGLTSMGTTGTPAIWRRDAGERFVFSDPQQSWAQYPGTLDQLQDPTLAISETDPPAHRGIAHVSLANWNLGAHDNRAPFGLAALVRARNGETVAQAIQRICQRTMPAAHCDVSKLRGKALLGYAVPGGTPGGQALQPLLTMYAIAVQDRGGVATFLDERDLPVVPVRTHHLNARPAAERTTTRGFVANRVDRDDIPERVTIDYIDSADGRNEMEGDGVRAPGSPDRGGRDTLGINLRPLVERGFEVKRRAREVRRRITIESRGGPLRLGPGYLDVLPGTCLFFRSNNHEEEKAAADTIIDHDTRLRDLIPGSVVVDVTFANGQVAALRDNGNGKLEGFPAGITASVNDVDYDAGHIDLDTSVDLDDEVEPLISYRYEKLWLVRVKKAIVGGYDFTVNCDVVVTTTDNPLPPVPRELTIGLGAAIVPPPTTYRTHVIDVPALAPGHVRSVWIGFVAAPDPSGQWRGGIVYESPNGTDRWTAVGQIQLPSVIGTVVDADVLPKTTSPQPVNPAVVDWTTELEIDLPGGETLEDATHDQIAQGANWLLVGDEIIAFHEAEAGTGTTWILRGLLRALRFTHLATDTHVDGERVVLLTNLGYHGLWWEPPAGFAAANRTYYFRVVPGGASIDDVATITTLVRGNSALPAPPVVTPDMLTQKGAGAAVQLTWLRRSIDQTTVFGPSPMQPGEFERFEVVAFNIVGALGLIATLGVDGAVEATATQRWTVTAEETGSPVVDKLIVYEAVDYLGHGYVPGVTPIGFVVYQIGPAGKSGHSDIVFLTPA